MTLYYILAIAGIHEEFRDLFIRLDAVRLIGDCESLSHLPGEDRWLILCAPSTLCLKVLSGAHPGQCTISSDILDYARVGPHDLINRLLIQLMGAHVCEYRCSPQASSIPLLRDTWSKALNIHQIDISLDIVASIICYPCPSCGNLVNCDSQSGQVRSLLLGLLEYAELRGCNFVLCSI